MSTASTLESPRSLAREIRLTLVVLAVCLLAVLTFAIGRVTASHQSSPVTSSSHPSASAIVSGPAPTVCHPHRPC
jgi:hypothetical protein